MRTDGNNFLGELAAASVAIKACPINYPLILHTDSTATIGSISKGAVSERRRIRAAGRPWLNFRRNEFLEKHPRVKLEHISSHKGTSTKEQQGNDTADIIANEYRRLGESKHYPTSIPLRNHLFCNMVGCPFKEILGPS